MLSWKAFWPPWRRVSAAHRLRPARQRPHTRPHMRQHFFLVKAIPYEVCTRANPIFLGCHGALFEAGQAPPSCRQPRPQRRPASGVLQTASSAGAPPSPRCPVPASAPAPGADPSPAPSGKDVCTRANFAWAARPLASHTPRPGDATTTAIVVFTVAARCCDSPIQALALPLTSSAARSESRAPRPASLVQAVVPPPHCGRRRRTCH